MPISLATYIQPKNATNPDPALRNRNYVVEDVYLKGGYQVRLDNEDRDSIVTMNRKAGMMVLTQDTNKLWILSSDMTTWLEFKGGSGGGGSSAVVGQRNQMSFTTASLAPGASVDFPMLTGASIIANMLKVSGPCVVQIFTDIGHKDTNPYTFVALTNHLVDDGSYVDTDGVLIFGRRFTVLMNADVPETGNLYFRITNLQDAAAAIVLDIEFLSLES